MSTSLHLTSSRRLRTTLAGAGLALGAAAALAIAPSPAAAASCGLNPGNKERAPAGAKVQWAYVLNCHSYSVRRKITVSNFPDHPCTTFPPGGQTEMVFINPIGSSGITGMKAC